MLIGRGAEVELLAARLDRALEGESSALVVHGEPGIGKSALLTEVAGEARQRGMRVLRARGVEAETEMPFAGLSELLGPVLDLRAEIPGVQAQALGVALALEPPNGPGDRFVVGAAVVSLLAAAAEREPLLAVVDDGHWLDEPSLDSLLFAARRLGNEGGVLLFGARSDPDRGLLARGMDELALGPLGDDDAHRLLEATRTELARRATDAASVVRSAGGNPLALLELPADGSAPGGPGPAPTGSQVEAAYRTTLERLPEPTRRTLTLLAADETASPIAVAAALERLDLPADAPAAAERAGVLEVVRDGLRFRHPLLRSVAYRVAPVDWRRRVHAALAEVMVDEADPLARAWHLAAAAPGYDAEAAEALEDGARSARARGATTSAASALTRAAELTSDPSLRAARLLAAARDWAVTDRPGRGAELASEALALTADPLQRSDLERVRGEVMIRMGRFDEAHELLTVAAEQVAAMDRRRAAELYLAASVRHRASGSQAQMRRDAERALELVPAADADVKRFANLILAHTLVLSGERDRGDALIAAHEEELGSALAHADSNTELLVSPAHASMWAESAERSERIVGLLIGRARQRSAVGALLFPLGIQAQLQYRAGRWRAAYASAEEAARLALDTSQLALIAYTAGVLAEIEASMGLTDEARANTSRALEITDPAEASAIGMYSRAALGLLELGAGMPAQAVGPLTWCAEESRRLGMRQPNNHRWAANLVEALLRSGRTDEAELSLEELEAAAQATGGTWARGCALRCRGLLEPSPSYERPLSEAIAVLEGAPSPFEAARARLALGERRRRDKRRREARPPLQAALAEFERLGARPWAERARAELESTGTRVGAARSEQVGDLTPHELRVALLVAQGRSNPDVAAELFVSRKTVEFHLSQIYRKLGVRSRTELAWQLANELPGPPEDQAAASA